MMCAATLMGLHASMCGWEAALQHPGAASAAFIAYIVHCMWQLWQREFKMSVLLLLLSCSYSRIARCSGHSSYVRHLDWSANSKVVQSSCGAYELLYFDAATGKQVGPAPSKHKL